VKCRVPDANSASRIRRGAIPSPPAGRSWCAARRPGSAYAAWRYSPMSPLRIVRRRTRACARSVGGRHVVCGSSPQWNSARTSHPVRPELREDLIAACLNVERDVGGRHPLRDDPGVPRRWAFLAGTAIEPESPSLDGHVLALGEQLLERLQGRRLPNDFPAPRGRAHSLAADFRTSRTPKPE